jgi:hypothetical protein
MQLQEPVLFYSLDPSLHSRRVLTDRGNCPHSDGCAGREYPSTFLQSCLAKLSQTAPLPTGLKNLTLSNADQIAMLADVHLRGKTVEGPLAIGWRKSGKVSAGLDGTGSKLPATNPGELPSGKISFVLIKTPTAFSGSERSLLSSFAWISGASKPQ